jgi:hypothetical protein
LKQPRTARAVVVLVSAVFAAGCASGEAQDTANSDLGDGGPGGIGNDADASPAPSDSGGVRPDEGEDKGDGSAGIDGGACAVGGTPCTLSNPCLSGVLACTGGTASCVSTGNQPDGTSCGANFVCLSGTCTACEKGSPCAPANACHTGRIDCSTGRPTCQDTGTSVADGTSCGSRGICASGTCDPCGAHGEQCCAGGACGGSPLACIAATASSCHSNVTPQCTCGRLEQGMELESQAVWSCDGRFQLVLQGDGNLVLYMGNTALWSSATVGSGATFAVMQDDGNFVVYTSGYAPVWSSGTAGAGCGAFLALQGDGNLVVYNASSKALWNSRTCCH